MEKDISLDLLPELILEEVRPEVLRSFSKNSCVVTARVAIDVLAYFGIKSQPLAVEAFFWNDEFVRLVEERGIHEATELVKIPRLEDHGGPWTISLGLQDTAGDLEAGHVVVYVPEWDVVYDLSADQISRPHKGLDVPTMSFFLEGSTWVRDPEEMGIYRVPQPEDSGFEPALAMYRLAPRELYKKSPNWRGVSAGRKAPITETTGQVIRAVRKKME